MILRDTAHQDAEQKIHAPIQEKEDQVNAVRHRVQNNLQIVTSLMGLQARMMTGPQTQLMVQEGLNRVRSMELLQERLCQSNLPTELDYRQYLRELAAHLYSTYGVSTSRVSLNICFADSSINLDAAVPCGLILNELISNCLKHAFPHSREGEIRVESHKDGDRLASLVVADNGVGLPEDVNPSSTKSLGLRLVRLLSKSLGAAVQVNTRPGTEFKLVFGETNHSGASSR